MAYFNRLSAPTVIALLLCVLCGGSLAVAQSPPGYSLVWEDDFTVNSLDTNRWAAEFSTSPTNNSLQAYLPANVSVGAGNLTIVSTNLSFGSLPYRSGLVKTIESRKYGRWEVTAQLPTSTGMWPAIWLLPDTNQYPWPSGSEIDIMENRGDEPFTVSSAFHYGTNPPFNHQFTYDEYQATSNGSPVNFHDGFHEYAVEWDANEIRYFVDDDLYHTVSDASVGGRISGAAPMQLIINTAIGGQFLTDPNASTVWPQRFFIDSVKVYEPTPVVLGFQNGGFDAAGGSLDGWTDFGNTIGNVSVASEAVKEGSHSLKLYGPFEGANTQTYSGAYQGIAVTAGDEVRAVAESFIRSQDSINGTSNAVTMNIDYFSVVGGSFGSADYLSTDSITIANGGTANNTWNLDELRGTAPAGAVEARVAFTFSQPGNEGGAVHVDNVMFGLRGDYTFIWDESGDGAWTADRWTGGYGAPNDFDNVVIKTNRVTASGSVAASNLVVDSGVLDVAGNVVTPQALVLPGGSVTGSGTIQGNLDLNGTLLIDAGQTLDVTQNVSLISTAELALDDNYNEPRGTKTGDFVILSGATVTGTFPNTNGMDASAHLGDGRFLWNLDHQATQVVADIYSALIGDANGDGIVDVTDLNIWNTNRFATNADWTMGDFNLDGNVNTVDFDLWNANRFSTTSFFAAVPEPSAGCLFLLAAMFFVGASRRK